MLQCLITPIELTKPNIVAKQLVNRFLNLPYFPSQFKMALVSLIYWMYSVCSGLLSQRAMLLWCQLDKSSNAGFDQGVESQVLCRAKNTSPVKSYFRCFPASISTAV